MASALDPNTDNDEQSETSTHCCNEAIRVLWVTMWRTYTNAQIRTHNVCVWGCFIKSHQTNHLKKWRSKKRNGRSYEFSMFYLYILGILSCPDSVHHLITHLHHKCFEPRESHYVDAPDHHTHLCFVPTLPPNFCANNWTESLRVPVK